MVLDRPASVESGPLRPSELEEPTPGPTGVVIRVDRCGVCRTDLHVVEGDLPVRRSPLVPGHEIVGTVVGRGPSARRYGLGARVGIPWLRATCGVCEFCRSGRENLCPEKRFTGYTDDGGYAERATADEAFVLPLPDGDPTRQAPLLCAGLIGFRALKRAEAPPGGRVGFFGFGGSAHLTLQLAGRLGFRTVAYSRDPSHIELARDLGADAAYLTRTADETPGAPDLDAAIVFAPSGEVVVQALRLVKKGGTVAIAGIHLSPIPTLDYDRFLFGERTLRSVEANTRADALEYLELAHRFGLRGTARLRPLGDANLALQDLKGDRVVGTVVLDCTAA